MEALSLWLYQKFREQGGMKVEELDKMVDGWFWMAAIAR